MNVRQARADEFSAVLGLLEAALLQVDADRFQSLAADAAGAVLVAEAEGPLLGALLLDGREIEAVAVRPNRRGQGTGRSLVAAARERVDGPIVAEFEADVRPFYERLGFDIEPVGDGRCRGRLTDLPSE